MNRIVVDTNVYISALVFGGVSQMVFDLIEGLGQSLYISQPIMAEVAEVLARKFGWTRAELEDFLWPLWQRCIILTPTAAVDICDDPDDDRILECAAAAGADFIVTGDHDLLRLKRFWRCGNRAAAGLCRCPQVHWSARMKKLKACS